ncbi:MAG: hypothetical protein ACTSRW_09520 [Candidatus Helarchaeota archaeon]
MVDELEHVRNLNRFLFGTKMKSYRPSLFGSLRVIEFIPSLISIMPSFTQDILNRLLLMPQRSGFKTQPRALIEFLKFIFRMIGKMEIIYEESQKTEAAK